MYLQHSVELGKKKMSFFKKSKSFKVSERDPTYKVRYLGNVQTSMMMKGDGCVDKPVKILWDNYTKNAPMGLDMKLTVCAAGLKAHTKEQGLTEYRAHRISYCVAHPKYPKLFVWVYRHEGKKMKVELRCHAVLCKTEEKAKAMAVLLHDKLSLALSEFLREKTRSQNSRLTLQRTNSLPSSSSHNRMGFAGVPLRKKMLSTGQNFKPSVDKSSSAPKLGAISEDREPEVLGDEKDIGDSIFDEDIDENEEDDTAIFRVAHESRHSRRRSKDDTELNRLISENKESKDVDVMFDVEIGNDIAELKKDEKVQFLLNNQESDDDDSSHGSESGFSEQESRETGSAGSGSWADSGIENDTLSADLEDGQVPSDHSDYFKNKKQDTFQSNNCDHNLSAEIDKLALNPETTISSIIQRSDEEKKFAKVQP